MPPQVVLKIKQLFKISFKLNWSNIDNGNRTGKTDQEVKTSATKPQDLNSVPHGRTWELTLERCPLTSTHICMHTRTQVNKTLFVLKGTAVPKVSTFILHTVTPTLFLCSPHRNPARTLPTFILRPFPVHEGRRLTDTGGWQGPRPRQWKTADQKTEKHGGPNLDSSTERASQGVRQSSWKTGVHS